MINGVLYASNGIGLVEAFDPSTGKTDKWFKQGAASTSDEAFEFLACER